MNDSLIGFIVGWIFGVFFIIAVLCLSGSRYIDGVKAGQIDAINGKIKYELVKQCDNSTRWELKEEANK